MPNFGSAVYNVYYKSAVDSNNVNNRLLDLIPKGIYSGGYLTKVNNTIVSLSTLVCEITDGTYQIRIQSIAAGNVTVGTSTPYVVLRWTYVASETNYWEVLGVSSPSANDLVVGKCLFSGSTLTMINYAERSTPNALQKHLLVEPTVAASMYVRIRGGKISFGSDTIDIVDQLSPIFSTSGLTTGQSRIDVIVCDSAGSISLIAGTPATTGNQVAPSYDIYLALAEVTIAYGQTTIVATNIRVVSNAARVAGNVVLLTGNQTVAGIKTFSSFPLTPSSAPTTNYQTANKKYVDDEVVFTSGSWANKTSSYGSQQATTNGIVVAYASRAGDAAGLTGYTDSNSTPTTVRAKMLAENVDGTAYVSIMFPVKKDDYWRVTLDNSSSMGGVFWLPLGV